MSFLDRSVPIKYAILGVIAVAVFASMSVHELHSRSDSMAHYGPALTAEVVKADEPKTVGSIFGFWGETYTNTEVKVTTRSGQRWYYDDVPLAGRMAVGDELKAWYYDGDPDSAYFEDWFETSSKESDETPWPSIEDQFGIALVCALLATFIAAIILKVLSPKKSRKRSRPASSEKPAAM